MSTIFAFLVVVLLSSCGPAREETAQTLFAQTEEFIEAVMEHEAQLLGMSALLTTTMPNMGKTIDAFEETGIRSEVKILVGGAPVSQ